VYLTGNLVSFYNCTILTIQRSSSERTIDELNA